MRIDADIYPDRYPKLLERNYVFTTLLQTLEIEFVAKSQFLSNH